MVVAGGVCLFVAAICAVVFWIQVARAVMRKANKKNVGKGTVISSVVAGLLGWVFFFSALALFSSRLMSGGPRGIVEKAAEVASVTREAARKGWTAGLLKKLGSLDFTLEKIQEVEDELSMTSSSYRTYEATLVVKNSAGPEEISYRELQLSNAAFVEDENGVFTPAFIINHSNLDEIPWLLRFLAPNYRRKQSVEFIPAGASYLTVRADIAEGHRIARIGICDKMISVDEANILPLKKDDNLSKNNGLFEEK